MSRVLNEEGIDLSVGELWCVLKACGSMLCNIRDNTCRCVVLGEAASAHWSALQTVCVSLNPNPPNQIHAMPSRNVIM